MSQDGLLNETVNNDKNNNSTLEQAPTKTTIERHKNIKQTFSTTQEPHNSAEHVHNENGSEDTNREFEHQILVNRSLQVNATNDSLTPQNGENSMNVTSFGASVGNVSNNTEVKHTDKSIINVTDTNKSNNHAGQSHMVQSLTKRPIVLNTTKAENKSIKKESTTKITHSNVTKRKDIFPDTDANKQTLNVSDSKSVDRNSTFINNGTKDNTPEENFAMLYNDTKNKMEAQDHEPANLISMSYHKPVHSLNQAIHSLNQAVHSQPVYSNISSRYISPSVVNKSIIKSAISIKNNNKVVTTADSDVMEIDDNDDNNVKKKNKIPHVHQAKLIPSFSHFSQSPPHTSYTLQQSAPSWYSVPQSAYYQDDIDSIPSFNDLDSINTTEDLQYFFAHVKIETIAFQFTERTQKLQTVNNKRDKISKHIIHSTVTATTSSVWSAADNLNNQVNNNSQVINPTASITQIQRSYSRQTTLNKLDDTTKVVPQKQISLTTTIEPLQQSMAAQQQSKQRQLVTDTNLITPSLSLVYSYLLQIRATMSHQETQSTIASTKLLPVNQTRLLTNHITARNSIKTRPDFKSVKVANSSPSKRTEISTTMLYNNVTNITLSGHTDQYKNITNKLQTLNSTLVNTTSYPKVKRDTELFHTGTNYQTTDLFQKGTKYQSRNTITGTPRRRKKFTKNKKKKLITKTFSHVNVTTPFPMVTKTRWHEVISPITILQANGTTSIHDQIVQILSDNNRQEKMTQVGPGVIKFLKKLLNKMHDNELTIQGAVRTSLFKENEYIYGAVRTSLIKENEYIYIYSFSINNYIYIWTCVYVFL